MFFFVCANSFDLFDVFLPNYSNTQNRPAAFVNNTNGSYLYAYCLNLTQSSSYKNHNRIKSPSASSSSSSSSSSSTSSIINENSATVIMTSYWKDGRDFNPISVHLERTVQQKYEDIDTLNNHFVSPKYLDWLCTKVLQGTLFILINNKIYFLV